METTACPKVEKCPIFQGTSFNSASDLSSNLQEMYRKNFCLAGEVKFKSCKRYIAAEALKVPIPKMIMPNSNRTIEEIREMIEKENKMN